MKKLTPRQSLKAANDYIAAKRREAAAAGIEYRAGIRWNHDAAEYYVQDKPDHTQPRRTQ